MAHPAHAADVDAQTLAEYERYIAGVEQQFSRQIASDRFLETDPASLGVNRPKSILVRPGSDDGIIDVHDGVIHHWRGAAFISGAKLDDVLAVTRNFRSYTGIYPWMIGVRVFDPVGNARNGTDRVLVRMKQSAGSRTGVIDMWTVVHHRRPRPDRATAISNADCIRDVERAGRPDEYLRAPGTGRGYLWRANTFAKYLQRDGGVYVELDNIGLSRDFPPMLGWLIGRFARRIGRGSVEQTLTRLRDAITGDRNAPAATANTARLPTFWCTE
jgi:hypothetical protein